MPLRPDLASGLCPWPNLQKYLIFVALLLPPLKADLEEKEEKTFAWKSGPWGHCVGECGPSGLQSRSVWCVQGDSWVTHISNCNPEEEPSGQRNCFKICDWHRELFEWDTSEWDTCILAPYPHIEVMSRRPSECVTAQRGLQHRQVNCVNKTNRSMTSSDICEYFNPRPVDEQSCLVPCPQDCILSEFSPWSTCSKTCGKHLQYRTRFVISPPLFGGSDCPNLTEWKTCPFYNFCAFGEEEYTYSVKVGPWSECRLPHPKEIHLSGRTMLDFGSDSGERSTFKQEGHRSQERSDRWNTEIGYQTRQVQCMRSDGKNALLSICTQDNMPLHYQSCVMPNDCEVSEWSEWSSCSKTCQLGGTVLGMRSRRRSVKHIDLGGGKPCPELEEKEACNTGRQPPCLGFSWKTSEWMDCQVSLLTNQDNAPTVDEDVQCGGGIQTRKVFCGQTVTESGPQGQRKVYRPMDPTFCEGPPPPATQLCNIPCQEDCLLSPWTDWGPCIHDNCPDLHGKKGFKFRRRHVLVESVSAGGDCPHLEESVPCDDPVCYRWAISGDYHCVPENGECGHGRYHLNTTCRGHNGQPVSAELCVDEPPVQLVCKVPCSQDCVISEWSEWSPCSRSCSAKNAEGKQSRTRSILAYPGEGGKPCPSSQSLHEYRLCNDHPCSAFYWEVSLWEPCKGEPHILNQNGTLNKASTCGFGVQTQKSFCMKSNTGQVTSKRCPDSTKPATSRPCPLPCTRDCVVTLFSEWTPCPSTCQPGNNSAVKQSRYRIVIKEALNGGQQCPDTLYEERECEDAPVCLMYRWKPQDWSQCVLVPDYVRQGIAGGTESCGAGMQSREMTCITADSLSVDVTECIRWAGPVPPTSQECNVPCKEDCTFTPWSKFTSCSVDCPSYRIRRRSLTGRSKKRDRCQNSQLYPLVESEECACEVYKSQPYGNWSDCIIRDGRNEMQLGVRTHWDMKGCGEGVRLRAVACYDLTGRIVEPGLCSRSGYIEEACEIPCPFDCKLSDWSSWSSCSVSCSPGGKVRSKFLKQKPYNGGRPCPKLDLKNQAQVYEVAPCYSECNQYLWVSEPWSACKLHSEGKTAGCGIGIQIRRVRCMNMSDSAEDAFVNNTYCVHLTTPSTRQNCSISCTGECVMSSWGPWSHCIKSCDSSSVRSRTRFPLRIPVDGKTCPEAFQTEACVLNSNCFHYHYNVTEWSACQLGEKAVCGEGVKTRLLDCTRSDGKSVKMAFCEQLGLKKPEKMSLRCLVECTIDCRVSDWTAWSPCSQTCGLGGMQKRSRHIIIQAEGDGRPCPAQLTQYKNCPVSPCYLWRAAEWSVCKVENGQCGEGMKTRNLTCVVHDGSITGAEKPVDAKFCSQLPGGENPLNMQCYVPCPGDCHLGEWSHWSSCEVSCIDGRSFETVGRQSRSRTFIVQSLENQEDCPKPTIETRPCAGGKCFRYLWKMSPWKDNKRTVWCQRSDGANVTGGCSPNSRPAAARHCDPPCRKPFSYCMQSGVCGCEDGYTQIMRSSGVLDYCVKVPGSESKKADVKTFIAKNKPINGKLPEIFNWSFHFFDQDGRVSLWVYVVCAGSFLILIFLILISYLVCRKPQVQKSPFPQQKPLTLAYDGDFDM